MNAPEGAAAPRAVRKDVARNRAKLLAAARAVFAERGLQASLDDVARAAGVGIGTAYRHFANKQELAAEILRTSAAELATDLDQLRTIEDPWQAVVSFFELTAQRMAGDRALQQQLVLGAADGFRFDDQVVSVVTEIFDRARAAGVLRTDAEPGDAGPILGMLGVAYEFSTVSPDLWRRYLSLILDGLRATDREPLPVQALDREQLEQSVTMIKSSRRS